jgi:hypothetical protein
MKRHEEAQRQIHPKQGCVDPLGPAFEAECGLIHSRFVDFTRRLPQALATRTLDMRTYLGKSAKPRRTKPIPDCIRVVTVLPYVLRSRFPVQLGRIRTLSYALTVGGLYAMAEDKLIDSQADPELGQALLVPSLYCEFVRTLHEIFPPSSDFWQYYDKFFREYQMAELAHRKQFGSDARVQPRKYCRIIKAKSAPMKLAVCGMAILSGRREHLCSLLKSFDYWIIGYQLYDDVVDWQEDYFARRDSLIGARIRQLVRADRKRYELPDLTQIVHSSDVIESALEESSRWFVKAEKFAEGKQYDDWIKLLQDFASVTRRAVRDLVTLKVRILFDNREKTRGGSSWL